jgi:membrane protease YdiL (CAAX protease family)
MPILTAALFSSARLPNWFRMAVALLAGYGSTCLYRRHRDLYSLGVAHGMLGFLLYLVIPDSIGLRVNQRSVVARNFPQTNSGNFAVHFIV